jgi:hypothetical protein
MGELTHTHQLTRKRTPPKIGSHTLPRFPIGVSLVNRAIGASSCWTLYPQEIQEGKFHSSPLRSCVRPEPSAFITHSPIPPQAP